MKRAKKSSTAQAVGRSGRTGCSEEIADAAKVIAWASKEKRLPPHLAFTAGPERQAAYWIEWAVSWMTPFPSNFNPNAPALPPQRSGGRQEQVVGNSGGEI